MSLYTEALWSYSEAPAAVHRAIREVPSFDSI